MTFLRSNSGRKASPRPFPSPFYSLLSLGPQCLYNFSLSFLFPESLTLWTFRGFSRLIKQSSLKDEPVHSYKLITFPFTTCVILLHFSCSTYLPTCSRISGYTLWSSQIILSIHSYTEFSTWKFQPILSPPLYT